MGRDKALNGKVIIITGSSGGIGKCLAKYCCQLGAHVVINGRNETKLQNTVNEFLALGYNILPIRGDITNYKDCVHIVQKTNVYYGEVDVLINNASLTMNASFESVSIKDFKEINDVNLIGAVQMTKATLVDLKRKEGSVIFLSSLAGLIGLPTASGYSASKMALTAFWQSLRIELSTDKVHVGIAYISFTENDPNKQMYGSGGQMVSVPKRPKLICQSQEKVARLITKQIVKRKSKIVLSPFGKIVSLLFQYFPQLSARLLMKITKINNLRKTQN